MLDIFQDILIRNNHESFLIMHHIVHMITIYLKIVHLSQSQTRHLRSADNVVGHLRMLPWKQSLRRRRQPRTPASPPTG